MLVVYGSRNEHHKDIHSKEIALHVQHLLTIQGSIINIFRGIPYVRSWRKGIFTLTSKFYKDSGFGYDLDLLIISHYSHVLCHTGYGLNN